MKVTDEMIAAWVAWTGGPDRKLTPSEIGCLRQGFYGGFLAAQGMARDSAEPEGLRGLSPAKPGPKDAP